MPFAEAIGCSFLMIGFNKGNWKLEFEFEFELELLMAAEDRFERELFAEGMWILELLLELLLEMLLEIPLDMLLMWLLMPKLLGLGEPF